MKRVFIFSDESISFGELREAEIASVAGIIVKNRNGEDGCDVEEPVVEETDEMIQITIKKK